MSKDDQSTSSPTGRMFISMSVAAVLVIVAGYTLAISMTSSETETPKIVMLDTVAWPDQTNVFVIHEEKCVGEYSAPSRYWKTVTTSESEKDDHATIRHTHLTFCSSEEYEQVKSLIEFIQQEREQAE